MSRTAGKRVTLHTLAAETVTGQSGPFPVRGDFGVTVRASAVAGTSPTVDFEVEWSVDGTNFVSAETADTFTRITAAGGAAKAFTAKAPWAQLKWTIGGTSPSFTFEAATS